MDVLSDVLNTLQLRSSLYFRTRDSGAWGVQVPAYKNCARFHLVVNGQCHVSFADGEQRLLNTGDMVIIPRGAQHSLRDHPDSKAPLLKDVIQRSNYDGTGPLTVGTHNKRQSEVPTELICGHFGFAKDADHPLLRSLPDFLHINNSQRLQHAWLDETMTLISKLMFAETPGSHGSVIRLSEVLFVEAIRAGASNNQAMQRLLHALLEPRIGKALAAIHQHPSRDWTVASLGAEAAMSRSRFAARFNELVGCSPMAYLAEWRMQRARQLLSSTQMDIQSIAADVGYQSGSAFSRAYKQHFGLSPAQFRSKSAVPNLL